MRRKRQECLQAFVAAVVFWFIQGESPVNARKRHSACIGFPRQSLSIVRVENLVLHYSYRSLTSGLTQGPMAGAQRVLGPRKVFLS